MSSNLETKAEADSEVGLLTEKCEIAATLTMILFLASGLTAVTLIIDILAIFSMMALTLHCVVLGTMSLIRHRQCENPQTDNQNESGEQSTDLYLKGIRIFSSK